MPSGAWSTRVRLGIAVATGRRGVRAAVVIAVLFVLLSGVPAVLTAGEAESAPRGGRLHAPGPRAGDPLGALDGIPAQRTPTPEDDIPDVSLTLGGASHTVDVAGYFSDAVIFFEVTESPNGIVRLSWSGSEITIEPLAVGSATITVTGRRLSGRERKRFDVTVSAAVSAPTAVGTVAAVTIAEGTTHSEDASEHFEGSAVTYTAESSDEAVATVDVEGATVTVTAVAAGDSTVTVTATNGGGSAEQSFVVTVVPPAPATVGSIEAVTIAEGATHSEDASEHFEGSAVTYTAESSDEEVATVELDGATVTVTAVAAGDSTVTVTATNSGGSAEQSFDVTVSAAVSAPTAAGSIAAVTIIEGDTHAEDASAHFEGSAITYTAESSDSAVATVEVDGATVTVTAVAAGDSTVTVTATNAGGSAEQSFVVTVVPPAPVAASSIAAVTIIEGDTHAEDASAYFEGSAITYTAESSGSAVATVDVDGATVTVTAVAAGEITVTVAATNGGGSAEQSFDVTVSAAVSAPTAAGSIAAVTIIEGDTHAEDASAHFEGSAITYTAESSDSAVATVEVDGATVTVTAVAAGDSTVTVTATNAGGSAEQSFVVTVVPPAPVAAGSIETVTIAEGATHSEDASAYFEGSAITYTAESSDSAVATVEVEEATVTVTAVAAGDSTVKVTATNAGGSAEQSFVVTVAAPAPVAAGSIEAVTIAEGATHSEDASAYFEGSAITYTAESSDSAVATVEVEEATVTVTAVAAGDSTVTVTATNAGGSAEQSLVVTVVPPAPIAEGEITDPVLREKGAAREVELAEHFGGAVERYEVDAEPAGIVHVWESDGRLALTPLASGVATVTVTAANAGGVARQAFLVTVRDGAPRALGSVPLVEIIEGEYSFVDAAAHFDGDDLTFAAESSNPHVVAAEAHGGTVVVRAFGVGIAVVTVTATNGAGSAAQETVVVVSKRAPRVIEGFEDLTFTAGTAARTIDLANHFLGDSARYGASAEPGGVVHLWESAGRLTLTPLAAGSTTVVAWSTNSGGMASQTFEVSVRPRAPRTLASSTLLPLSIEGLPLRIELANYFAGAVESYAAAATPGGVVHLWESGGMLTLTPLAAAQATVRVTALNEGGSAVQAFTVLVQPAAPRALGRIVGAPLSAAGAGEEIALADYFVGDVAHYEVASWPHGVLHLWESRGRLRLTPLSPGVATVTVTASNGSGSAAQTFAVAVGPAAPRALGRIERIELAEGGPAREIELGDYFGGEAARYHIAADPGGVVHGWESGGRLTLTPLAAGVATVVVTATNSAGSAEQVFIVAVAAAAPAPLGGIEDVTLTEGAAAWESGLADHFSGAVARYRVSVDPAGVVHAWVAEGRLRLTPLAAGIATVVVTASNEGGSARQELAVTVSP